MGKTESLGIRNLEAVHYYVRDLERSRRFYTERMDFAELAKSNPELEQSGGQRSVLFQAGDCKVLVSTPQQDTARAARYFRLHPDGIGTLIFNVEDIEHCFSLLEKRGGTPITDIQHQRDEGGSIAFFSITTPFGDTTFRFIERKGYRSFLPGIDYYETPAGGKNAFGFECFDHVTSNFQTMAPAVLWLEHVMGFEPYWDVSFHTQDHSTRKDHEGSGLKSKVMWDPHSAVKFANNEPMRPNFKQSQINIFHEDHRGDGVQHLAMHCKDIIAAVRGLRANGISFMPTPGTYYDMLPDRLKSTGIKHIDEDIQVLRELEVLIDGNGEHRYLLQIFLEDSAAFNKDQQSGAFFYEVIQRKGDPGFGAGNFRALFESIERQQQNERV